MQRILILKIINKKWTIFERFNHQIGFHVWDQKNSSPTMTIHPEIFVRCPHIRLVRSVSGVGGPALTLSCFIVYPLLPRLRTLSDRNDGNTDFFILPCPMIINSTSARLYCTDSHLHQRLRPRQLAVLRSILTGHLSLFCGHRKRW